MVISSDREPPEPGGVLVTLAETGAAPAQSDAELVSAIAAGERVALAALYDRYATTMLALAQRILGMRTQAEDLVRDLFSEGWQTAQAYDAAQERELVALIYGQGLPLNDAAARLGVPLGTTKSRLRRILAKLRQCLAGYPDEV